MPPAIDQPTATLVAATIAALATAVSAVIAATTARRVSSLQPQIEQLRHELAAQLAFLSFRRQRLNSCLDEANAAYIRLFQLSQMVGRMVWIEGPQESVITRVRLAEETLHECTARIETAVSTIVGFQVLPQGALDDWRSRIQIVRETWRHLMGEVFIHIPGMAERYQPRKPDSGEYVKRLGYFEESCKDLGALIHALPATVDKHERGA